MLLSSEELLLLYNISQLDSYATMYLYLSTQHFYLIITFPNVAIKRAKSVHPSALRNTGTYLYLPTGLRSGKGMVKNIAKQ